MNRKARRAAKKTRRSGKPPVDLNCTLEEMVEHLLHDAGDIHVVVTPVVWHPTDGSTAGPDKAWRADRIMGGEEDRNILLMALASRRPLVIHDMDDELQAAKFCEVLWPGERITNVRKGIEIERGERLR
jgi:hypothetical protein